MGRDPCGVYSVSSFLLGIGVGHLWRFSAFVVYMRDARWSFYFIHLFIYFCVALRLAFMGHWGGTLVAFTGLVGFLLGIGVGRLWRFSAFVAFIRHAGWSVYFICLFIYLLCGVAWRGVSCSVYGALGWDPCGVHSICSVYQAFGAGHFLPISSVCSS